MRKRQGESIDGIIAVAFVVHNRLQARRFGQSYCDVVKSKGEFWYKVKAPHSIDDRNIWEKIVNLSYYLINDDGFTKIDSPVADALFT